MDVKSVIEAILLRHSQKAVFPPMRTRLVKLAYLAELEYFRRTGRRLTSLDWMFYQFGPYAAELEEFIGNPGELLREGLWAEVIGAARNERPARDQDLDKVIVDVVHDWGQADLNDLLDYVYFETEPMQAAKRGEALDFSTVQRIPPPRISLHLDESKIKKLRNHLRQRSTTYAELRRPSIGPEELFGNLREWDAERSSKLSPGPCSIDPDKLNSDK